MDHPWLGLLHLRGQRQQRRLVARSSREHDADRQAVGGPVVGSETAGLPVTFHIEVYGVNRFCASKSAAGSSSLRSAPTGRGGRERRGQHGVVRRE